MPEPTLRAFDEHGTLARTVDADPEGAAAEPKETVGVGAAQRDLEGVLAMAAGRVGHLADQLAQPLGPQRALDHPVLGVGDRRHHTFLGLVLRFAAGRRREPPGVPVGHVRPRTRSAARSATDTSTWPSSGGASAPAPLAAAPLAPAPSAAAEASSSGSTAAIA